MTLFTNGILTIDCVKSRDNITDPLMKGLTLTKGLQQFIN